MVHVPAVGVLYDIDIQIPKRENKRAIPIPCGTAISAIKPEKLHSRQAGVIADLDDERFSEGHGLKGFWEPGSFFDELGGNIYFLEEYDPVVIPSWIDMQPDGDFINSLYRKDLPESVVFYMLSGYKGSRNPFRSNNDSTITLSSILDYRPQTEAKMNYVFNEDHTSILFSKEVVEQYNTILDEFVKNQDTQPHRSGGYVKIRFEYSYDFESIRPMPIFVLLPSGKKNAEIVTYLSDNDNGRILGPYLPGEYLATMFAMAAKPQEKYTSVTIEMNKTKELSFVFSPDGMIQGCVTVSLKPEDKFIGRPEYSYRSADESIHVQSIELKGNGIKRVLRPVEGNIAIQDYIISREDFCQNKCFGFFGLPAGEYKLYLKAQGYIPVEKNYSITPGKPQYFRVTELIPD